MQRACTPARRARRERSGKQAARVHATVSRATSVQAANTPISKQRCTCTCACEYHERGSQASAGTQRAYRVCCTRARTSVCVREAQCSERDEACEGAAKPSALSHSLIRIANSVATELQLTRAPRVSAERRFSVASLRRLSPWPLSVASRRAAPCALLQPPRRHGAQTNDAIRKSQETAKKNGSVSSFSAPGRAWHNYGHRFFPA